MWASMNALEQQAMLEFLREHNNTLATGHARGASSSPLLEAPIERISTRVTGSMASGSHATIIDVQPPVSTTGSHQGGAPRVHHHRGDIAAPTLGSTAGARPEGGAADAHTPRTLEAAQWLAQLPNSGNNNHAATRAAVDSGQRQRGMNRERAISGHNGSAASALPLHAQTTLAAMNKSIDECLRLIDKAKQQPGASREQQETLRRVAVLEEQIRQYRLTTQRPPPQRQQLASEVGDAPQQLARRFEDLLRPYYTAQREGPFPPHGRDFGATASEVAHESVSVAHQPRLDGGRADDRGSHVDLQIRDIVSQAVQECVRSMHIPSAAAAHTMPTAAANLEQYRPGARVPQARATPEGLHGVHPHSAPTSWMNRELRLPKFKGETDENPLDFLNKFERFAAALPNLTIDQACRQCMPLALTDDAEQWLITVSKRWPALYSYEEFSVALINRFLPHDYVDRMRRFLETRMQGENETLARFITVIETAYGRMGVVASEREVIRRISSQLNPTYNQLIGHRYFASIEELSQHARAIDAQVHRQRAFRTVEADCPDADLKVKGTSAQATAAAQPTAPQSQNRRGGQRFNKSLGASDAAPVTEDKSLPSRTEEHPGKSKSPSTGESVSKERLCYTCGDPSHLANSCPLRSETDRRGGNKRAPKNGQVPPSPL